MGDYKLMEHLLTGEQKLFNVVADYQEKINLIDKEPQKARKLKESMSRYLELIDAEDVQDVYQARFAELDRFEAVARQVHVQSIKQAKGDRQVIADADARLAKDLIRFDKNREECHLNMRGKTF